MVRNLFRYTSFDIDDDRKTVHFSYEIVQNEESHIICESIIFPVALVETPAQYASLRALHLALGISYYKVFSPPVIDQPYSMSAKEADFWNNVWRNGLGEFLYINDLPVDRLAKFSETTGLYFAPDNATTQPSGALLGIGGGKDSIVAGELLKIIGVDTEGFVMATGEQLGQTQQVATVMNIGLHAVQRILDNQLLTLQEGPGAYKGHIPISLIFGLVGTALGIALGKQYVVVANEASASTPRLTGKNGEVNHQWSKSFEFEKRLQRYIHDYVTSAVTYFSVIRSLTSVAVAKIFASYPQYYEVFTSDNYVFRIDPAKRPTARWSLESPKSLSSFILLAPWITESEQLRIFGRDFLDEKTLEMLFLALIGQEGTPPLDCVGTTEELLLSLNLASGQNKYADSYLMRLALARQNVTDKDWGAECDSMLALKPETAIPPQLRQHIASELRAELKV